MAIAEAIQDRPLLADQRDREELLEVSGRV